MKKRTTVCGTPIYLSPEIIKEQGHDERVVVCCIGVII
jgi:serine/threonine protein kinase